MTRTKRISVIAGASLLAAASVSALTAATMPTAGAFFNCRKSAWSVSTAVHAYAVRLEYTNYNTGAFGVAAQENMDGSWSVNWPLLLRMAAAEVEYSSRAASDLWPLRVLVAWPFLRHESFQDAERVDSNVALRPCHSSI